MTSIGERKRGCSNEAPRQKKRRLAGCPFELTLEEQKKLVKSSEIFHGSVVRIYVKTANQGVVGTGTAFLVYRRRPRSLFLTCEHNFGKCKDKEISEDPGDEETYMIRFLGGTKDLRVEKIIMRDEERDLLLFSVKNFPSLSRPCMELSTAETVRRQDKAMILGYVAPTLFIDREHRELVMVKKPSVFTGQIICDPYVDRNSSKFKEKIWNSCKATKGVSGSPLLKNNNVVGVHLATDKDWREAISVNTVFNWIREELELEDDNSDTIDKLLEMVYDKEFQS